jgi:Asp-tRNA(Asn)/Glu-tRNA(Gln) amidotransferase A subunit family amidase
MASGVATSVSITEAYLARIAAYDRAGPALNTILRLNPMALTEAIAADRERAAGVTHGPLHGIPVIVKENFDVSGLPTSGGSLALAGLYPVDDAAQVRMLREAGAVILGKTNMDEFGMAFLGRSSLSGQTRNPYSLSRSPGGSSGGTAVAVTSSFAAVGWGTDTCGSLRMPAAHASLVSLRPTVGLSSTDGVLPVSHTGDVAAPIARTVSDLAIALDATVGFPESSTESLLGTSFTGALEGATLEGVRIGLYLPLLGSPPEARTGADVVLSALERIGEMGAEILLLQGDELRELAEAAKVVGYEFKWDVADYLATVPGDHFRSLDEILESGLLDEEILPLLEPLNLSESRASASYLAALDRRTALRESMLGVMEAHRLDAIAYPTVNSLPQFVNDAAVLPNCSLSTVSGFPSITIPAGFSDGLPVGLELLARPFADARLVGFAHVFEKATRIRRPPASVPPLVKETDLLSVSFRVRAEVARREPGASVAGLIVDFTWSPMTSDLSYDLRLTGLDPADVYAVVLRGVSDQGGQPVIRNLAPLGTVMSSETLYLGGRDRARLVAGELYVEVFTREFPQGAGRAPIVLP